jgi:hypothetical protein
LALGDVKLESLVKLGNPESPVKLENPESPVKLGNPESPVKLGNPESPVKLGNLESPVKLGNPESPVKLGNPESHVKLGNPESHVKLGNPVSYSNTKENIKRIINDYIPKSNIYQYEGDTFVKDLYFLGVATFLRINLDMSKNNMKILRKLAKAIKLPRYSLLLKRDLARQLQKRIRIVS